MNKLEIGDYVQYRRYRNSSSEWELLENSIGVVLGLVARDRMCVEWLDCSLMSFYSPNPECLIKIDEDTAAMMLLSTIGHNNDSL